MRFHFWKSGECGIPHHLCVCICLCVHICMDACLRVFMCVCVCVCVFLCVYVCLHASMCLYTCMFVCVCLYMYVCECVCAYLCACLYAWVGMCVIYWPSTEPSIKRCTSVNNPKKQVGFKKEYRQGARGRQLVGDRNAKVRTSLQRAGPWVTHGWATQPRCEISAAMVKRKTWANIAVCPCLHWPLTHNRRSPFRK